jgi:hypothetical protein
MKIKYVFDNYYYYGSFPNEDYLNSYLVKSYDNEKGIVYFNNTVDKTLWLIEYDKDISEFKKTIEKFVQISNKMSIQFSKKIDAEFIKTITSTAYYNH